LRGIDPVAAIDGIRSATAGQRASGERGLLSDLAKELAVNGRYAIRMPLLGMLPRAFRASGLPAYHECQAG
jgi:hypothetical protein